MQINKNPSKLFQKPRTYCCLAYVLFSFKFSVVVDYPRLASSPTGLFELIYEEHILPLPTVDLSTLKLEGAQINKNRYFTSLVDEKKLLDGPQKQILNLNDTKSYLSYVSKEMKDSLLKLLNIIQGEKERRKQLRNENKEAVQSVGSKENCYGKSDKNTGNTTILNEIFTQTFSETDELTEQLLDSDLKKSYLTIKGEFKEIFKRSQQLKDLEIQSCNINDADVQSTSSRSSSNYLTPKPSVETLLDIYKENPRCIFKDVYTLIDNYKISKI